MEVIGNPNKAGDAELSRVTLEKIFERASLSEMDRELLHLRFVESWYLEEIGEYIGNKYEGKPLVEGTIRYRIGKLLEDLRNLADNRTSLL